MQRSDFLSNLSIGAHTFEVKSLDLAGNEDLTPVTQAFTYKPLAVILSFKISPKIIKLGKTTTIKGQLKDSSGKAVAGKKVALQAKVLKITKKKVKGKIKLVKKWIWKTIAKVTTNSQGVFSKKQKPKSTTSYRAVFGKDYSYKAVNCNVAKVVVKKAKNK